MIWHANAFARVATFQDQSLEGDPVEVSNVFKPRIFGNGSAE